MSAKIRIVRTHPLRKVKELMRIVFSYLQYEDQARLYEYFYSPEPSMPLFEWRKELNCYIPVTKAIGNHMNIESWYTPQGDNPIFSWPHILDLINRVGLNSKHYLQCRFCETYNLVRDGGYFVYFKWRSPEVNFTTITMYTLCICQNNSPLTVIKYPISFTKNDRGYRSFVKVPERMIKLLYENKEVVYNQRLMKKYHSNLATRPSPIRRAS